MANMRHKRSDRSSGSLVRLTIPNMLADVADAPTAREAVAVWRVVFFGRFEERKGIKLFLQGVQVRSGLLFITRAATPKSATLHRILGFQIVWRLISGANLFETDSVSRQRV